MISALLFAVPWYIHKSSTEPNDQIVEEIAFLDDVIVTQGSKIDDCKEPTPFPAEKSNLGMKHPWHNPLNMLFLHVAINYR